MTGSVLGSGPVIGEQRCELLGHGFGAEAVHRGEGIAQVREGVQPPMAAGARDGVRYVAPRELFLARLPAACV